MSLVETRHLTPKRLDRIRRLIEQSGKESREP